jgi:uncharacterized protein YlaI
VRARTLANRGVQFIRQCLECGSVRSQAIKHADVHGTPPPFDEQLAARYLASLEQAMEMDRRERLGAFREEYDVYLKSPEWKSKRARALKRDGYLCQGCLERRATQVHHRTYDHVGAEVLFELISLCDDCHQRLHEDRE